MEKKGERKTARKNLMPPAAPEMLTEITLAYMKAYIKDQPREEQLWYVNLVANNQKEMPNHLKGAKGHENDSASIKRTDVKPVRAEFAKKYFPALYERSKSKNRKESYLDSLLADLGIDESEIKSKQTKGKK